MTKFMNIRIDGVEYELVSARWMTGTVRQTSAGISRVITARRAGATFTIDQHETGQFSAPVRIA